MTDGNCNGLCVTAADIGVGSFMQVAYPHPACPEHGDAEYCEHCEGWGSIAGPPREFACPMCGGSGIRYDR